ncbi:MAG: hypothetical protein M1514_01710 [Patescibacteria group bacterium]|nr:hypothetical protein [Patescibacteria group bacterium]
MKLFGSKITFSLQFSDLVEAITGINSLLDTDPRLKLNLISYQTESGTTFQNKLFFTYESDILRIFVTDGFRALVYILKVNSSGVKACFSIGRQEANTIPELNPTGTVSVVIAGGQLSLTFGDREIKLVSFRNEKNLLTFVDNLFKKPILAEVKVSGQELQHHTSLFGMNENLTLVIQPEKGEIEFERSETKYKDSVKAEITGSQLKRTIDPKFIFPYIISLKEKDAVLINFYDPYLIEIKTPDNNKFSYLLMPILTNN